MPMPITREELYNNYFINKQKERTRCLKKHLSILKKEIIKANNDGYTNYTTEPDMYDDEYIDDFVLLLKELFVDSIINIKHFFLYEDPENRMTTFIINWKY